ncbi:MAG: hypothetical protein EXR59_00415 [Dehalococcoidia bacterium]|nr:hypothetical protein [Dehalococcoidia bacterium]
MNNTNDAKKTKDTKTGNIYNSRAEAGQAIAPELGLDPNKDGIWFEVASQCPLGRFVDVASGLPIKRTGRV